MANVVKNYVDALYSLINNNKDRNQLEEDLQNFVTIYNSNEDLKKVLSDPCLENKVKNEIVDNIFSKSNANLANFVKLLIKEKRINLISEMLSEYENVNRTLKKELFIQIIVSEEIDDMQIDKIVQKFKNMYKVNTVKYSIEIDKKIIGGIKVIVGNTVYDASIKRQLEQIF